MAKKLTPSQLKAARKKFEEAKNKDYSNLVFTPRIIEPLFDIKLHTGEILTLTDEGEYYLTPHVGAVPFLLDESHGRELIKKYLEEWGK